MAFVGVDSDSFGTLTLGRQYTPYFNLLAPYGPARWLAMHPGDIDGFDYLWRANNSINYLSPKYAGLRAGGAYALAGIPGALGRGSTWSGALQYDSGPIGFGIGFQRINNATSGGGPFSPSSTAYTGGQAGLSALTNGYQTARAQQRFAVAGTYTVSSSFDISLTYANVQYIPGILSKFSDTAIFNIVGTVVHWKPGVAWDVALGYSHTAVSKANGKTDSAKYNQVNLTEYYALSKRTGLYAFQAYQRASGKTLGTNGTNVIDATPTIGDYFQSTPASCASQVALMLGVIHWF